MMNTVNILQDFLDLLISPSAPPPSPAAPQPPPAPLPPPAAPPPPAPPPPLFYLLCGPPNVLSPSIFLALFCQGNILVITDISLMFNNTQLFFAC